MQQGIRETLVYHRSQRKIWLAIRDKLREPKRCAQGRSRWYPPRPLPPTRGEQLWHASATLRGQLWHFTCVVGVGMLSLGVLAGLGIGLYHLIPFLTQLMTQPSLTPTAVGPVILPFGDTEVVGVGTTAAHSLPYAIKICSTVGLLCGFVMMNFRPLAGIALLLGAIGIPFLLGSLP